MGEDLAFGALLRRLRLTASLSQAVLGERAHVSTNAIAALESIRGYTPFVFGGVSGVGVTQAVVFGDDLVVDQPIQVAASPSGAMTSASPTTAP